MKDATEDNLKDQGKSFGYLEGMLQGNGSVPIKRAIAVLKLKTGHQKRWIKEEIIDTAIDAGLLKSDGDNLFFVDGKKLLISQQ
jgi:hypothetical protein